MPNLTWFCLFGLRGHCRLAHVKKNKFSPRRMPLAVSSQRVNIWYRPDPHDQ